MMRAISLGAGLQSSAIYRMSAIGELPRADCAIFADTQCEPPWVYEALDQLERDHGAVIPIHRATAGNLAEAVAAGVNSTGGRFAAVPFWVETKGAKGAGRRQCTREYKIDVITRKIRELLGYKPRQRIKGIQADQWIGITVDEAGRAKPSRMPWLRTVFPFLDMRQMRRGECQSWLEKNGYPVPGKSACIFCPYRRPKEYARWREEEPELFEQACQWDELIRSSGTMKGTRGKQYVSDLLVPLRDIPPMSHYKDENQIDLFMNECEGMCGV